MSIVAEFLQKRLLHRVRYVLTEDKLIIEVTGPLRGLARNEFNLSGIDPDFMYTSVSGGPYRRRMLVFLLFELAAGIVCVC